MLKKLILLVVLLAVLGGFFTWGFFVHRDQVFLLAVARLRHFARHASFKIEISSPNRAVAIAVGKENPVSRPVDAPQVQLLVEHRIRHVDHETVVV